MNRERRKRIDDVTSQLMDLQEEVQALIDEEQECYDNLPEGLQSGHNGSVMENSISYLEQAFETIASAMDELENAK